MLHLLGMLVIVSIANIVHGLQEVRGRDFFSYEPFAGSTSTPILCR
jgi:hypothetical protein